jgi:hypothetical protein
MTPQSNRALLMASEPAFGALFAYVWSGKHLSFRGAP